MSNIILATQNRGKIKELNALLEGRYNILSMADAGFHDEIIEDGITLAENAFIKANTIHSKTGLAVIADDSGLFVDCLDGDPGIYSARYGGLPKDDSKNITLLLNNMKESTNRKAHFACNICFIDISNCVHHFEGKVHGSIINDIRGQGGFGYDPIFVPIGYDYTFAELDASIKNKLSHRANAVASLLDFLNTQ